MITDPFFVRNLTYGLEDSLISTTGVLVGVASAGFSRKAIIITGLILILVEATSMAFGAFLAEENFLKTARTPYTTKQVAFYALVMFLSYTIAGLIPLLPFVFGWRHAVVISMLLAMTALFSMIWIFQRNMTKAIIMTSIGYVILVISIKVGMLVQTYGKPK
jgi:VIT1/CCC1 family predicted Fe2+/Mn2+ transporter